MLTVPMPYLALIASIVIMLGMTIIIILRRDRD